MSNFELSFGMSIDHEENWIIRVFGIDSMAMND